MRRHFRFGADATGQSLIYAITNDWSVYSPYWISMQHKSQIFENLVRGWGTSQDDATYIQHVKWVGDAYIQPDVGCPASHFTQGFKPYLAVSPLPVFLLNGFVDRNFVSFPPILLESRTLPP